MRAYPTPPDVDPLSPLEEVMSSDDEFVEELCSSRVFVEKSYENIRFYGKSSEIALANQLANEKRKGAGVDYIQNRRQEFWDVPDVSLAAFFVDIPLLKSRPVDGFCTQTPHAFRVPYYGSYATSRQLLL